MVSTRQPLPRHNVIGFRVPEVGLHVNVHPRAEDAAFLKLKVSLHL